MAFDRPYASHRTFEALANSVRMPHDHGRRVLLAAKEQGETIGIAELDLPEEERSHVVELGIHVLPVHRWRGVGTELWRAADDVRRTSGRTLTTAEVTIPRSRPWPSRGRSASSPYAARTTSPRTSRCRTSPSTCSATSS